ncbi:MAG TPA: hemolysin family protein [Fibrobacteria bacterium]|nr:hemolysin family protein [Fibrobacteria bacterium]
MILSLATLLAGIVLSAHFSTVRSILGIFQRPGWRSPEGWATLEQRTRTLLDSPAFPVTVSLGRSLGTLMFVLGGWNALFPDGRPGWLPAIAAGVALLLFLYLIGDFFPRLAARLRAQTLLASSLRLHGLFAPFFLPAALPVVQLRKLLEKRLGWDGRFDFLTEHERAKIAESAQNQEIQVEQQIIRAVLDLGETRVRAILTPRLSVVSLPISASREEALEVLRDSRYSRFPVHDGGLDHVVGILHAKDLVGPSEEWDLEKLLRPVVHVPETQLVSDLLRTLRARQSMFAVVVDEHGAVSGIATLEDVLEEIVGEINDETDDEAPLVAAVGGGQFLVRGEARLEEVNQGLGRENPPLPTLEDGLEADTLAGLVLALAGSIPEVGEPHDWGSWEFTVLEMDGNRISLVRLQRLPDQDQENAREIASEDGQSSPTIPRGTPE